MRFSTSGRSWFATDLSTDVHAGDDSSFSSPCLCMSQRLHSWCTLREVSFAAIGAFLFRSWLFNASSTSTRKAGSGSPAGEANERLAKVQPLVCFGPGRDVGCAGSLHRWSFGGGGDLLSGHRKAAWARRGATAALLLRDSSTNRQDRAARRASREARRVDARRATSNAGALRNRRAHPGEGRHIS